MANPSSTGHAGTGVVILFDGVCNFCTPWVPFIIKRDPRGVFKFAAIQSDAGQKLYREHGLDPAKPDSILVIAEDGPRFRSDAMAVILTGLGGVYRLLGRLLRLVPRGLRDWGYDIIARNRYRWFGTRETCLVPTPEIRERFLS